MTRKGRSGGAAVPYSSDVDFGIPSTLVELFKPGGVDDTHGTEELRQRIRGAVERGRDPFEVVQAVLRDPATKAWHCLHEILLAAESHPDIEASKPVAEFVGILAMLVNGAPFNGGAKHVFDMIERAQRARASQAARKPGIRQDVIDAWNDDARRGGKEHGRIARIAGDSNLGMSPRNVAYHLEQAGLRPKKRKRK